MRHVHPARLSSPAQEMATPAALREWCRATCARYPNVEIKNMSSSFRDGLAFCAIIHKHRPDLIDFGSLSKDSVYQNNKLAFEIAETKLGIPALLDPKDMVSTKVPDRLSVITYLSQYYYFFNRKSYAGPASLGPSHVTVVNNLAKSKTPDGLKLRRSSTDRETSREDGLSNIRPRTVCNLCFKPVHLIQRHLIDGKVYHRSCFRCKVCHSSLLPGSYTQGSDSCSLICTHHITDSKSTRVDLSQQIGSTENRPKCKFQAGYISLGGLAISSVPHYTKKTESQDRLVCKTPETERQERSREVSKKPAPPHLPAPSVRDRTAPILADSTMQQEAPKTQEPSELSSPCARVTEGSSRPVPAPRRMLGSSVVPVPAPRTKTSQTADNSSNQNTFSPSSSHITSPTSGSLKVKTNHPWLALVHPGPWTQLPPAAAPVPTPRSKSVSNLRSWYRPREPPPNPFGEDADEDTQEEVTKPEPVDQTKASGNGGKPEDAATAAAQTAGFKEAGGVAVPVPAEGVGAVTNTVGASSEPVDDTSQIGVSDLAGTGHPLPDVTEAAAAGPRATSDEAQSHTLPRSLSVPAICATFPICDLTEANESDQVRSCQSKLACKENPFDRNPAMPKSKTFQSLSSRRAPAPGHGFPLIKRKVQTDQNVSTEDLQVEMRELDKHLEALEQRGVELERNLRDCKNDKEEERMLMEWFSLTHERHVLVHRDTELVYLTKQQKLEERQADVEYELRCLLNKPENDWSQEDRGREQQLMDELVAIIEQRNEIISSLDQDRQRFTEKKKTIDGAFTFIDFEVEKYEHNFVFLIREREEDRLLEAMMKNKEFQKEGLKELKKSKRKFKPTKVFKMLRQDSMEKKS